MEFFKRTDQAFLHEVSTLTLAIKCPLFVQLRLSTFDLTIIQTPNTELEAYVPNVGEIGTSDHNINKEISQDIEQTTAALLINPMAYQKDGCDKFASQVIMPVSTYTTLIVHGSYNEWRRFCHQTGTPSGIKAYADAVQQIMTMEWR